MLVADASAVVALLLRRGAWTVIDDALAAHRGDVCAPEVLDLEVLSTLRRRVAHGSTPDAQAAGAVDALQEMPIERIGHEPFVGAIWRWRHVLGTYDAAYLTLADALGAKLLTADARLARIVERTTGVEVVLAA